MFRENKRIDARRPVVVCRFVAFRPRRRKGRFSLEPVALSLLDFLPLLGQVQQSRDVRLAPQIQRRVVAFIVVFREWKKQRCESNEQLVFADVEDGSAALLLVSSLYM